MQQEAKLKHLVTSYCQGILRPDLYHPLFGHLWLTRRCNLKCSYCHVNNGSRDVMEMITAKKAADVFWQLGVRIVGLMGGEPLMHPQLIEIVRMLNNRGFITYLSTNGYLITENNLENLMRANIDVIDLSIDSVESSSQSKKSVRENEAVLTRLLEKSRKTGAFAFKLNTVLTADNWSEALDVVDYAIARRIRISVGIESTPTLGVGKAPFAYDTKLEKQAALILAANRLIEIKKSFPSLLLDPLSYFRVFKAKVEKKRPVWECSVGKVIAQIDWNGKFFECSKMLAVSKDLDVDTATPRTFTKTMKEWRAQNLDSCNRSCLSNCAYNVAYLYRHPTRFLLQYAARLT